MSKPAIVPEQTASGIALDPRTLERVIPESKRPDGTVRKQLKIRPGYTPQEDVSRFRSTRQQQLERNTLPKGHILGWVAPSSATKKPAANASSVGASVGTDLDGKTLSKSAAKNAKRKAKKQAEKEKVIRETWDDSDDDKPPQASSAATNKNGDEQTPPEGTNVGSKADGETTSGKALKEERQSNDEGEKLAEDLEKLDVR